MGVSHNYSSTRMWIWLRNQSSPCSDHGSYHSRNRSDHLLGMYHSMNGKGTWICHPCPRSTRDHPIETLVYRSYVPPTTSTSESCRGFERHRCDRMSVTARCARDAIRFVHTGHPRKTRGSFVRVLQDRFFANTSNVALFAITKTCTRIVEYVDTVAMPMGEL